MLQRLRQARWSESKALVGPMWSDQIALNTNVQALEDLSTPHEVKRLHFFEIAPDWLGPAAPRAQSLSPAPKMRRMFTRASKGVAMIRALTNQSGMPPPGSRCIVNTTWLSFGPWGVSCQLPLAFVTR